MKDFEVTNIVDGDTFDVSPRWVWNGKSGERIRPTGFDAPELDEDLGEEAAVELSELILGETVQIGDAYRVDRGRLVCDVFFEGQNLASYFQYNDD